MDRCTRGIRMANLSHPGTGNKLIQSVRTKSGALVKQQTTQAPKNTQPQNKSPLPSKFSARNQP